MGGGENSKDSSSERSAAAVDTDGIAERVVSVPVDEARYFGLAEVKGGLNDVEVFILKETEKNSGVFRGYINTQPGQGREVQGVVEAMPGNEIRFGYVDFANAKGERNSIAEVKLPVISGMMSAVAKKE